MTRKRMFTVGVVVLIGVLSSIVVFGQLLGKSDVRLETSNDEVSASELAAILDVSVFKLNLTLPPGYKSGVVYGEFDPKGGQPRSFGGLGLENPSKFSKTFSVLLSLYPVNGSLYSSDKIICRIAMGGTVSENTIDNPLKGMTGSDCPPTPQLDGHGGYTIIAYQNGEHTMSLNLKDADVALMIRIKPEP